MNPRVNRVTPAEDHKLHLEFTNGEQGVHDCSSPLDVGVFKELKDRAYFERVTVCDGTVVWPSDQDICPDTLYLDSVKVASEEA